MELLHTQEGIKVIGVGKRGSGPLAPDLVNAIIAELKAGHVPDPVKGAFFGALHIKGITPEEEKLDQAFNVARTLHDLDSLVEYISPDSPPFINKVCVNLLKGNTLPYDEAYRVGQFLFSKEAGNGARGLIASVLRVRYETSDEYAGILKAMQDSLQESFKAAPPSGEPIVLLSEPFDGVKKSFLITPLIAKCIQNSGYRVVTLVGRNSGPKYGTNLLDIVKEMNLSLIKSPSDLTGNKPPYGYFVNQQDMSRGIDQWVEIRRLTIKRPFMSTLERFVNPVGATIALSCAFHPPYGEKMIDTCERAGFKGAVIIRNGLEGTMTCPVKRKPKIMVTARQKDGSYQREEFIIPPQDFLAFLPEGEERVENPGIKQNALLIRTHLEKGKTDNSLFDAQVSLTCAVLNKALKWIREHGEIHS